MNLNSSSTVRFEPACEVAELDEQWSYVGSKAISAGYGSLLITPVAPSLPMFLEREKMQSSGSFRALLKPFGIKHFCSDDWGAYERNIDPKVHEVGKRNTQKIERKNLNFRTWIKRLARKTICFSKLEKMHDIVIGLLINSLEFGVDIYAEQHI